MRYDFKCVILLKYMCRFPCFNSFDIDPPLQQLKSKETFRLDRVHIIAV